jgi:1,4-dihydroxy-2-naphthoate octaprenyltransferase/chlorophyll synthase
VNPPSGTRERWIYAAKPGSWPKLLVPMLFGQAAGAAVVGGLDVLGLAVGAAFTICELLFVVFLNDVADRDVDALKRRLFPSGCSPKTIPDGILSTRALMGAGILAGGLAMVIAWAGAEALDRPLMVPAAAACLALFWAYSFPPLRLNYRGGGEWLEGLGVGIALPAFNFYAQSGVHWADELWLLPGFALLSLASATASGLADEISDRRGGKVTFATSFGNAAARRRVEDLVLMGAVAWAGAAWALDAVPRWAAWVAVAVVIVNWRRLRARSHHAQSEAFDAQRSYKRSLHHAVWRGAAWLALGLLARALG